MSLHGGDVPRVDYSFTSNSYSLTVDSSFLIQRPHLAYEDSSTLSSDDVTPPMPFITALFCS